MANYADARWGAFQFKLNQIAQRPEFKFKPNPGIMMFLDGGNLLVPASERERILGVKQSDQSTVEINILNKQSVPVTNARSYNHSGNKNDSTKETVTFTTYAGGFKYSIKSADRDIFALGEKVAVQLRSTMIDIIAAIESAMITKLNTEKSQVVNSLTPRSGTWDATNYVFQVSKADEKRFMQRVEGFMFEQYYRGNYNALFDSYLFQESSFLVQQGQGNNANYGFQFSKTTFDQSVDIVVPDGYQGAGYIWEPGTIGVTPWIPALNRQGFGNTFQNGGLYTTIQDPFGLGLTFAVHERAAGADNQSTDGETQDVDIFVEVSIDIAPIVATMSTANASPIFKFGVLNA